MGNIFIKNKKGGYALMFTLMVVSVVSVITAGLINAANKQLILYSLAKDSQLAFYQADTAGDCALYADRKDPGNITTVGGSWSCGGLDLVVTPISNGYKIYPINSTTNSMDPCFKIDVRKDTGTPNVIKTEISARGYNICDASNIRTVEREINIKFEE